MSEGPNINVLVTITIPDELLEQLRLISPNLAITVFPTRRVEDIPPEVWERTEILYTDVVLPELERVPKLRWLQSHYAGLDFAAQSPLIQNSDLVVTTLSGTAVIQMSEYVLMVLLSLGHRIQSILANQQKAEWPRDRWDRFKPVELHGATVGIIGYGSIGREVARLLQPFRTTLLAVKRDVMHPEDPGYTMTGLGDPSGDHFDRLYPVEALCSVLKLCDFIVVTLPLTPETRDLIAEQELLSVKPGAFLIDVGRGGVVNQAALLSALQEDRIAGAALDVFAEEPLPPNHPFWRMPNVIVSPHIAGVSTHYLERAINLFAENLRRYVEGLPVLNRFDPQKNY